MGGFKVTHQVTSIFYGFCGEPAVTKYFTGTGFFDQSFH